jgi:hypothetical protein
MQPINIPDDDNERTGRDRENAHIVPSSSVPNPEIISDTKCCCFFNRRTRHTTNKQSRK